MFSANIIQQLKKVSISADPNKTKERLQAMWKAASKSEHTEILSLSGLKVSSVYQVSGSGNITGKLAVAVAQTLNVDPLYLTGQTDEQGECSDGKIHDLLMSHGYDKLLAQHEQEEKKRLRDARKKKAAEATAQNTDENGTSPLEEETSGASTGEAAQLLEADTSLDTLIAMIPQILTPNLRLRLDSMTEDDLQLLLKALILRAKLNDENTNLAYLVKMLLLI